MLHIIFLLGICSTSFGQGFTQLIEWGDENFKDGDYYGASLYYERAMNIDSIDIDLLWKYAESLRLYNDYAKAEYYYAKIFKKERGKLYPMSAYHLAMMYKHNGNYKKAIKTWKSFNRKYKRKKDSYEYKKSQQELQSCAWARANQNDSVEVDFWNVGEPVNSHIAEFGAIVHDSVLYFSSLRAENYGEMRQVLDEVYLIRMYAAQVDGQGWSDAEALPDIINKKNSHAANGCFSPDGSRFYFTLCDEYLQCGIYMSQFDDGVWSEPVALKDINTENATVTQPSVALKGDREYLFFSSNREGGYGNMDIWYVPLKDGQPSGEPKNAGENVNSPDNEITPYYDTQSASLFFSSQWHNGYGGFDIFQVKGNLGDFTYPINIGKPFNSNANDFYYSFEASTGKGFLTSNRIGSLYKKSPTCCNDLWTYAYPAREDTLPYSSLEDLNKFLPVTLYFHNDEPDPRTRKDSTKQNYVDTYQDYINLVPEYVSENRKGKSGDSADDAEIEISDFFKFKVEKGVRDLKIFAKLLLIELEKGQEIELTIQGFASPLAKTDYNVHLTGRRITSLINFLYHYQAGVYAPYIDGTASNGGRLSFNSIPFGEYTADTTISANLDEASSIYSVGAASERRIQIISVQQAKRDSSFAEMTFADQIFDFGKQFQGDTAVAVFEFTNTGNLTLTIDSIATDCDCLTMDMSSQSVPAGGTGTITVVFNTSNQEGLLAKHVRILTNGVPEEKVLSVTTEVFRREN